ncbi:MAG: hypothetical protein ACP5O1_11125, partial [Phycisphaerae bacterium]
GSFTMNSAALQNMYSVGDLSARYNVSQNVLADSGCVSLSLMAPYGLPALMPQYIGSDIARTAE